jgi:hypothetical protein
MKARGLARDWRDSAHFFEDGPERIQETGVGLE